jgi:hypothetical protein
MIDGNETAHDPRENEMLRRLQIALIGLVAVAAVTSGAVGTTALLAAPAGAASSTTKSSASCAKFSGTVLLTYTNPDTIILHVIRGKVNAPTTFTMTSNTSYTRNGLPSSFAAVKIGDTGTITATEILPSGTLLACAVDLTGP